MNIAEKIRTFLEKQQNLPENKKKVILWTIVVILGLPMAFFWAKSALENFSKIGEELQKMPTPTINVAMPDINFGDLLNSQNTTESWQIYTNNDYGFEIKYPLDTIIKEDFSNDSYISVGFEENGTNMYVLYAGNSEIKNIVEITNPKASDFTEIKSEELTADGVSWNIINKISIPQEGKGTAGSILDVYTTKGNSTYILQCIGCDSEIFGDDGAKKETIFRQMISTFKFTK